MEGGMIITRTIVFSICLSAAAACAAGPAVGQACTRQGVDVSCDDGRGGVFTGDAIIWADGTRSNLASPHPSVIVGNKQSVVVGQGVFAGQGKGVVPMENPSDPRRACAARCWMAWRIVIRAFDRQFGIVGALVLATSPVGRGRIAKQSG